MIKAPEILLNHHKTCKLNLCLNELTRLVRVSHQMLAPVKIPRIMVNASYGWLIWKTIPELAKTARKIKTTSGLGKVIRNVEIRSW